MDYDDEMRQLAGLAQEQGDLPEYVEPSGWEFHSVSGSSDIASVAYEAATGTLVIQFQEYGAWSKNGPTAGRAYSYIVPKKVLEDLLSADSKGKFFHRNIKNAFTHGPLGENGLRELKESNVKAIPLREVVQEGTWDRPVDSGAIQLTDVLSEGYDQEVGPQAAPEGWGLPLGIGKNKGFTVRKRGEGAARQAEQSRKSFQTSPTTIPSWAGARRGEDEE